MIAEDDLLRGAALANPDVQALIDPDRGVRYSYRALDERVTRVADGLTQSGVEPGDRVGIFGGIDHAVIELVHGCLRIGAVPVPLDSSIGHERQQDRVERISISRLVATETATNPLPEAESVQTIVSRAEGTDDLPGHPVVSGILFTSGTTGTPAPVALTRENLVANAIASSFRLGLAPADRWVVCLDPFHMGGFAPMIRAALYGTGLVLSRPDAEAVTARIQEDAGTGVSVVPTLLERFLDSGVPLETLRAVLVGGDRTPERLVDRALEAGVSIYCSYGMTEAASQIATAAPDALHDRPRTVGHPLRGVRIAIVDERGVPIGRESEGEIVVRGPTIASGYLDGSHPERFTEDGGLRTGDLGYLDRRGRLYVTGRRETRIVSGGETVSPSAIESILRTHDAVADAAVVGIADERWGEHVAALLALADPKPGEEIIADLDGAFGDAERPRIVNTTDRVPRTASGTVDRRAVKRILENVDG